MTKYVELVIVADNREVRAAQLVSKGSTGGAEPVRTRFPSMVSVFLRTSGTGIEIALFQSEEAQTI